MSLETDIALLSRVPLFQRLGAEEKRLIAFSATHIQLNRGDVLFKAGEAADRGFVVATGRIELVEEREGTRRVLASCGPGSLIGEMALFTDTTRPAKAVAIGPASVLAIARNLMRRMLEEYPDAALRIREMITESLTATISELGPMKARLDALDKPADPKAED